ncbi:MAG: AlpA family phage regulatory protein [Nitrospina sp.]|nr:AlpA family phage regulatory protein [Nitrospina sp.]
MSDQEPKKTPSQDPKVLSIKQLTEVTGLSAVTVWRREKIGKFPRRRQLGSRRVGWIAREIDAWIDARPVSAIIAPANCGQYDREEARIRREEIK